MSRVLQDIKIYQAQRAPAPSALKWAYLGSVLVVVSMGAWVGLSMWRQKTELAAIGRDRSTIELANADIKHFTDLFSSLESTKRIDKSRKDWEDTCVPAADLELAVLRAIQDAQSDLRAKKEDKKNAIPSALPQIQIKSLQFAWMPKNSAYSVPIARIDITVIANVPKQGAQIALNKALAKWAEKIGFVVNSPRWGYAPGGILTLAVELRQGGA